MHGDVGKSCWMEVRGAVVGSGAEARRANPRRPVGERLQRVLCACGEVAGGEDDELRGLRLTRQGRRDMRFSVTELCRGVDRSVERSTRRLKKWERYSQAQPRAVQ